MSLKIIDDNILKNIANSIREKTGNSNLIYPNDMANEIMSIKDNSKIDYGLNIDMLKAKQICIDDSQDGFTYKVLQLLTDSYPYHDIKIPSGGAVKTSDGFYYTEDTKHIWDSEKDIIPEYYINKKIRWIITYYPIKKINDLQVLYDAIYVVIDGIEHSNKCFKQHSCLEYFEYINDGKYSGTSFTNMFSDCYSLKTIPEIDVSNGTTFTNMFSGCYSLKTIPEIDVSNGTNFSSMFYCCYSLEEIPYLNTINGTAFGNMFYHCHSLIKIDNEFNLSNAGYLLYMFAYCELLKSIKKITFGPDNTNYETMFTGMDNLEFIYLENISKSLKLSYSNCFSRETLVNGVLNGLVDLTGESSQTLTLGSNNLSKLTEEDKLIATNKNWILK